MPPRDASGDPAGDDHGDATPPPPEDVFLEDLRSERSMRWVESENARALRAIVGPDRAIEDDPMFAALRAIYDDKKKIPNVRARGDLVYNFWQDQDHLKGIWRRTTMTEFAKEDPAWETVLDVDALAEKEGRSWVWKGPSFLDYGPGQERRVDRCVVKLSDGGGDACVTREFDVVEKRFVSPEDEDAFVLPEGKNNFCWVDRDVAWVGVDRGEGTVSPSGYPLTIAEWRRGTKLEDAREIWRGEPKDVVAAGMAYWDKGTRYKIWYRAATFYDTVHYAEDDVTGEMVKVDVPSDFSFSTFADHVVIHCKSRWGPGGSLPEGVSYASGTVLAHPAAAFVRGERDAFTVLYAPANDRCAYGGCSETRDYLLVHALENMVTKVYVFEYKRAANAAKGEGGETASSRFSLVKEYVAPDCQSFSASGVDSNFTNDLFVTTDGFLTPVTLSLASAPNLEDATPLKKNTSHFDASGMSVELSHATSDDGTEVPYFLVRGAGTVAGTPAPTVMYGYGGFEIPMLPGYGATTGYALLSNGFNYVLTCIRGGGEFGPEWHRAAKKSKRWRAFEDFSSVAKDLCQRNVTTANALACVGGSNGGLLAGAMATFYPHLFGAVVSQCPLLDMERYVLLTSGPSWIDEYGDPNDAAEREFLLEYSPYHNLEKGVEDAIRKRGAREADANVGEHLPATLFTTSTADDRVHPSHARRFVHKCSALGIGKDVLYHEMIEGGHAGAADNAARAAVKTLENRFLIDTLRRGTRSVE